MIRSPPTHRGHATRVSHRPPANTQQQQQQPRIPVTARGWRGGRSHGSRVACYNSGVLPGIDLALHDSSRPAGPMPLEPLEYETPKRDEQSLLSILMPRPSILNRVMAGVLAALLTAGAVRALVTTGGSGELNPLSIGIDLALLTGVGLLGWFSLRGHRPTDKVVLGPAAAGAILVGGIGFLAGFVGPILLAPGANQGPLLGIFVTGPLGFAVGALSGAVVGFVRLRRRNAHRS